MSNIPDEQLDDVTARLAAIEALILAAVAVSARQHAKDIAEELRVGREHYLAALLGSTRSDAHIAAFAAHSDRLARLLAKVQQ